MSSPRSAVVDTGMVGEDSMDDIGSNPDAFVRECIKFFVVKFVMLLVMTALVRDVYWAFGISSSLPIWEFVLVILLASCSIAYSVYFIARSIASRGLQQLLSTRWCVAAFVILGAYECYVGFWIFIIIRAIYWYWPYEL